MIVDTSAVMAVLREEPEKDLMMQALRSALRIRMSAGSWIELAAVLRRTATIPVEDACDKLFTVLRIEIDPVTVSQAEIGRAAYREFGRGAGRQPVLNFGDCFAYALSKDTGEPLLFKGNDFSRTDIIPALA